MKREERRTAAREGILAAAHRQVAEGGCASASVAAVASRAGVAAGSLYRHFPSRAELLAEVVGDALRGERTLLERATTGLGPRDGLVAWTRLAVARTLASPTLARALATEPADAAVVAVRHAEHRAQDSALTTLLKTGSRTGAWPPADHALQATAINGALRAALVEPGTERLGPRPDARGETEALVGFVLGAVGAR